MILADKAIAVLQALKIGHGFGSQRKMKLAPYQKRFIRGAFRRDTRIGVLSIGRGNGKTALSAALALASLLGKIEPTTRREIIVAARTREQGRIAFEFVVEFIQGLSADEQKLFNIRRSPTLEITYEGSGNHVLKVIAADGKSALGGAPTFVIMDERGHWDLAKGDKLEAALLSGLGKRSGRCLIISTSAENDQHPFSQWCDNPDAEGVYVQEHRPEPNLPADDPQSLKVANPGAKHGIGSSLDWLKAEARRAIARGGSTLTGFRLYNRNERVSCENRDVLLTVDEWQSCEVSELPERQGSVVVGIDLGGSASMTAAAFYWPDTGRLECLGTFPSQPDLLARGQNDAVNDRYVEMQRRGELATLGGKTVPIEPWLMHVMGHVEGEPVAAIVADRYKQSEVGEALDNAGIRGPFVWRGMGFKDGGEDCERFRRAAFDGNIQVAASLLLRSAFAEAVCLRDPANNLKLAKARSMGRIDAASASVLAVAHGSRLAARPKPRGGVPYGLS